MILFCNKVKFIQTLVLALVVSSLLCHNLAAQQNTPRHLDGLSIRWNIAENNYAGKRGIATSLSLITSAAYTLPASGWKIYFNFSEPLPEAAPIGIGIKHVNGDLFYLAPAAGFKGINKADSINVPLISTTGSINTSDAPAGFYLVWDSDPEAWLTINYLPVKYLGVAKNQVSYLDEIEKANTILVYHQNELIDDIPADSLTGIFPTPFSYQRNPEVFNLNASVNMVSDDEFAAEAKQFKTELSKLLIPADAGNHVGRAFIRLIKKDLEPEAYELTVKSNGITIAASTTGGIFYGIQSLKTMMPAVAWHHPQKNIVIYGVNVFDKPRFLYRALMLDVARNFQPKAEILKLLDVMALYKLNVFHLHLSDDEGWRIEIPALPELTEVGAQRGHTMDDKTHLQPALGSGPAVGAQPGSGYYSRADFIEILKFATARNVSIVPEIESPGHARAAIKAMDERYRRLMLRGEKQPAGQYLLHHLQDSSKYTSVQYYNDNVVDVSLPSTYNFIETVTTEIQKMYSDAGAKLNTIHYGGDEVPAGAWAKSPAVLSLMKSDTTLKNTGELWGYYYNRINHILNEHHLYLTAWEEVGSENVLQNGKRVSKINEQLAVQNVHLEVWNNVIGSGAEDLAYKLANNGFKVILSCVTNLYFDMAYNNTFGESGYYWGGYADVDRMFSFIPHDYLKNNNKDWAGRPLSQSFFSTKQKLGPVGETNIVGLQGALWGETLKTPARMEYMLLPKLLGLAERAWAKDPGWATATDSLQAEILFNRAWSVFVNTIGKRELPRLDYYANGFAYRVPSTGAIAVGGKVIANKQLPGFVIHYTSDGSIPNINSPVYHAPITDKGVIKFTLFNQSGRPGKVISVNND